jgi:hypothetical protein
VWDLIDLPKTGCPDIAALISMEQLGRKFMLPEMASSFLLDWLLERVWWLSNMAYFARLTNQLLPALL